jgi:hypothetical protein
MKSIHFPVSRRVQRGSTLIVVVVLLLLLTLIGVFAVNVAVSEQRQSGTDLRARIVRQTAEAALAHGLEYVRAASLVPSQPGGEVDLALWEPCLAADTTFPCGSVPAARRGNMYRYRGGVDLDGVGGIDARERYFIPLPADATFAGGRRQAFNTVGNFPVNYGVGAVLCTFRADRSCTQVDEERTGLGTVTLVSWAEIPNENARITISEAYGSFTVLNIPPSAPPLVAGGFARGVGSMTLVPNPNSGGPGVAVSIWSRGQFDANNGSWQTCHMDEYMRTGSASYAGNSGVLVCPDCNCEADDQLSKARGPIGIDIQTPRGASNNAQFVDADADGVPDTVLPSVYFPCDMFEYVFGVRARINTSGGEITANDGLDDGPPADGIQDGEVGLPYAICENGTDANGDTRIDTTTAYLTANATILPSCAGIVADNGDENLFWVQGPCDVDHQMGTADNPVVIVTEGNLKAKNGGLVFGVLFGYSGRGANIDITESEAGLEALGPSFEPGGGKARVYGAIIVEGGVMANASIDLVASPKVIENFNLNPANFRYGVVPGSWTDRLSY